MTNKNSHSLLYPPHPLNIPIPKLTLLPNPHIELENDLNCYSMSIAFIAQKERLENEKAYYIRRVEEYDLNWHAAS